jgi:hypothetical protein
MSFRENTTMSDLRNYQWLDAYLEGQKAKEDLEAVKRRLAALSPIEFFQFKDGLVVADRRRAFVEGWKALQKEFCKAVSPTGHDLELSSEAERAAWSRLGLRAYVNPQGFEPIKQRKENRT